MGAYFVVTDPALVARRMEVGPRAETEPAQRMAIGILLIALLAMLVLPGFDRRFQWSNVPAWLTVLADLGIVAGYFVFFYVMKENTYAAATVRVESGQKVVSTGLYGVVRHPFYAADPLIFVGQGLWLGSWAAAALAVVPTALVVLRLVLEERLLRRELPRYAEYAARVRSRLVPGVW